MQNKKLMSEFYADDGSRASVYQVVNKLEDRDAFYSITYKDAKGKNMGHDDFPYRTLEYVNNVAEDWALKFPWPLKDSQGPYQLLAECIRSDQLSAKQIQEEFNADPNFKEWYMGMYGS